MIADIANHGQPAANAAHIANHGKLPKLSPIRPCSFNIDNHGKLPQPPMQLLLMASRLALPIMANFPKISQPPMQLPTLPIMPVAQNSAPSWQCCIAVPTTGGIVVRYYHVPSGGRTKVGGNDPKKRIEYNSTAPSAGAQSFSLIPNGLIKFLRRRLTWIPPRSILPIETQI
jgi:hypothetical protein